MRIAMISYHTCPLAAQEGKETGGMNVYVLELSKALIKKGYIVDVYTRIQDIIGPEIVELMQNFRIIHIPAGPKKFVTKKQLLKYIDIFSRNLYSFIYRNHIPYDVIHAHYYMSGLTAEYLKEKGVSKQIVMTFHTLALMKNLVARSSSERESNRRITIEKKLIKNASIITASSEADKEYLTHLYSCPEKKIGIVNPGIDPRIFHPIPKLEAREYIQSVTKDKLLLYVGRLEPLKGIDVLIHALKILSNKSPSLKLRLLIVGGNKSSINRELMRLKKIEKNLQIKPIVGYISQRNQRELSYYYNAAELVVMPSYYESFGMTALESMACGTPVIITDTSGISKLFDKELSSLIVSTNNPLQLANQIEKAVSDIRFINRYKEKVQLLLQHMTWNDVASHISAIYKNILVQNK
jgi:D-inositol-3-phosphate glycosyltransferase